MTTQTLVTCNGKINQHGFCDKCYQPSHTTSNQCSRLVPYQQAEINTVLAVSGPSEEEIDLAALQYATKMSAAPDKETPDWIMTDFKAGIAWLLRYQAACASGAVGEANTRAARPCNVCKKEIGNDVFTVCDDCLDLPSA